MSVAMHKAVTAHLPGVERLLPLQVIVQVLQDRWGGREGGRGAGGGGGGKD